MRYVGIYRTIRTRENYQKRRRLKNMQRRLRREKLRAAKREETQASNEAVAEVTAAVEQVVVSDNTEQVDVPEA
jgi:hypothetical protein